jgi:uncharacterized ion transporter superfamily protein YfcC
VAATSTHKVLDNISVFCFVLFFQIFIYLFTAKRVVWKPFGTLDQRYLFTSTDALANKRKQQKPMNNVDVAILATYVCAVAVAIYGLVRDTYTYGPLAPLLLFIGNAIQFVRTGAKFVRPLIQADVNSARASSG